MLFFRRWTWRSHTTVRAEGFVARSGCRVDVVASWAIVNHPATTTLSNRPFSAASSTVKMRLLRIYTKITIIPKKGSLLNEKGRSIIDGLIRLKHGFLLFWYFCACYSGHGLQLPQGLYPRAIASSLDASGTLLCLAMSATDAQSG